ncbi:MAG: IS1634 family transposase [bacterium]
MSNIITERVGSMPIIVDFLNKINLIKTIDTLLPPLRSNNTRLSHGKTCFVMILFLLCRPHIYYRVEEWVTNNLYLKTLFPNIKPEHFNDDRIGDTFNALHQVGIRNLFSHQSLNIIKEFELSTEQVHCDFTNFTVHGQYNRETQMDTITINYGYSKAGKKNKKQFAQEVAVTSDGGVPILSQSLDGNTADVTRYIPVWRDIKNLMGSSDFLTVGDCKLSSEENLLTIAKEEGYFLAPLAMYSTLHEELEKHVLIENKKPVKLSQRKKGDKTITYWGFHIPATIIDEDTGKQYNYRKIFVKSSQLKEDKSKTIDRHLATAIEEIELINSRLNRFKNLNTVEKITNKIDSVLKTNEVESLLKYQVNENTTTIKKQVGKGRPGPNTVYKDNEIKEHSLEYNIDKTAIKNKKELSGYFVLATNKPTEELSMKQALSSYKQEWKVEKVFARLKGPLQVVPTFLQLPEHIEALMFLLMTCAQIFTLMDREAENTLAKNNEKLAGLFPNKIKTPRPKAEMMLDVFRNIALVFRVDNDNVDIDISALNELQGKIIKITNVNPIGFNNDFIKQRLNTEEIRILMKKKINKKVDFNRLL